MTYRITFADTVDAERDLARVPTFYRRAIESAIADLEQRGPCIGLRLRGHGLDRFCRTPVKVTGRHPWRIIYRWPPDDPGEHHVVEIYLIGQEQVGPDDIYLRLERFLRERHVDVGDWDAATPRQGCCEKRLPSATLRRHARDRR